MTQDRVSIWNLALFKIGETELIENESVDSPACGACKLLHAKCLGELLESFPWRWATVQGTIAQLEDVTRLGWDYVYAMPTGCRRVVAFVADGCRYENQAFDVQATDDKTGKVICTDLSPTDFTSIEYVSYHEYVPAYPELFVEALACRIAAELALAIRKDRGERERQMIDYRLALSEAKSADSNAVVHRAEPDSAFVLAREQ